MRTDVIVSAFLAIAGALSGAPLHAEEAASANKVHATAPSNERRADRADVARTMKSDRRERVRYTFPPSKR